MSHFRAKKLDIGCYVNIRVIRDHTKRLVIPRFHAYSVAHLHLRKIFEQYETERYSTLATYQRLSIQPFEADRHV